MSRADFVWPLGLPTRLAEAFNVPSKQVAPDVGGLTTTAQAGPPCGGSQRLALRSASRGGSFWGVGFVDDDVGAPARERPASCSASRRGVRPGVGLAGSSVRAGDDAAERLASRERVGREADGADLVFHEEHVEPAGVGARRVDVGGELAPDASRTSGSSISPVS